jgi:hypothetical protein
VGCPAFRRDAVKRTTERPLFGSTRLGGAAECRTSHRSISDYAATDLPERPFSRP